MNPYLSFNTAASFMTNTNWQAYGGETTMSYLTQMLGADVPELRVRRGGIAVVIAMIRGFTRTGTTTSGTSGATWCAASLYLLLPLSVLVAIVLMSQGVVQTLGASRQVTGHRRASRN